MVVVVWDARFDFAADSGGGGIGWGCALSELGAWRCAAVLADAMKLTVLARDGGASVCATAGRRRRLWVAFGSAGNSKGADSVDLNRSGSRSGRSGSS